MAKSTYTVLLNATISTAGITAAIASLRPPPITIGVAFRGGEIASAIRNLIGIRAALDAIGQGVEYIKDLDKELTNVQVATGMSQESVEELALGYNNLAKEVGATTLEIAKGSLEWIRQGKTAEEAGELVKSSMVLSKLGNVSAAQSTEYLTSSLNGFKLEAKDSMGVIDKIISLDNAFATSAGIKNFA